MSPARTAAAARPGRRRFARGLRFGWSRGFGWSRRLGLTRPDRRGATSLAVLAAYLIVVVTAPAWHHHDHAGHDHQDHAGHGHAAAQSTACCGHGHEHAGHEHAGHEHAGHEPHGHDHTGDDPSEAPSACGELAEEPPHGHHTCPICELLATPATPVTAPTVCDLGSALPTLEAPTAPDRRAVFLRTKHARGPPRV